MQTLVELLQALKALAAQPDSPAKLDRILALFANPRAPAEFQVGRHYIARLLVDSVETQIDSFDPSHRVAAVKAAQLVFPRNVAARVLRRVVKDPDTKVRTTARRAVQALRLADVAPPDIRYKPSDDSPIGGFNPTGWAFGIFPNDSSGQRKPKKPARPKALEQHKLPKLAGNDDVAEFFGLEGEDELAKLMRPGCEPGSGYIEFEIPKAKGGTRRIAAPRTPLRRIQRKILDEILAKVPVHEACHGFVPGRSTVTNARPHQGAALVIKLDLKDFFPTVHYRRVRGLFMHLGYNEAVASTLAALTTYRPKLASGHVVWPGLLPQGAPTSPALANLACRRLDHRLSRLAAKCHATYTRYADDLTFSFKKPPEIALGRFLWWVDAICQQEGFTERNNKRRILRAKQQQRVTGLVVNKQVHIPRAERRRFRAILHNCAKHGVESQARGRADFAAYLAGYAAYIHMVEPALGKRYLAEVARLLGERRG